MNNETVVYKVVVDVGQFNRNFKTFISDDPTKALLIPELLEENLKKFKDYYQSLRFFEIATVRDDSREVQFRTCVYLNETLKILDTFNYDYLYKYNGHPRHTTLLPYYHTVIKSYKELVRPYAVVPSGGFIYPDEGIIGFNAIEVPLGSGRGSYYNRYVPAKGATADIVVFTEKWETKEKFETNLIGMEQYQRYLRVTDFSFHEGLAISEKKYDPSSKSYYGFVDGNGNVIIDYKYISAGPFSQGLARVMGMNEKFGFINKKGETVIPFIYDYAEDFHDGIARVAVYHSGFGSKCNVSCINRKGELLIDCVYDDLEIREIELTNYRYEINKKILEDQKRIEEMSRHDINVLDYIQCVKDIKEWLVERHDGYIYYDIIMRLVNERIKNKFEDNIRLYDFANSCAYKVVYLEKMTKVVQDDGTELYFDYDEYKEEPTNETLVKRKSLKMIK